MHILKPSEDGVHVQHPRREVVTRPPLDPNFFEPLALIDLSVVDPALAGRKCLCVAMNVGTCDEFVVLGEQDDGTWTVVSVDGTPPKDPTKGSPWAEPFENGPEGFDELPTFEAADLVEAERGAFPRADQVTVQTGEPDWVQGDDSPGGDWVFVARLDSPHLFGSMFVFYDVARRQAYHRIQFT